MTDHLSPTDLASLRHRAERGTARGPEAVLAAARDAATGPDELGARRDARRRRSGTLAAAAVIVVAAAIGGLALAGRDRDPAGRLSNGGGDALCAALARPAVSAARNGADVNVYLEPGVSDAARSAVADALVADERVSVLRYVDEETTLANFRELFAEEPVMLESVKASDLPTSFDIDLLDPTQALDLATEVGDRSGAFSGLATTSDYPVYDVLPDRYQQARVLDLLVWPGHQPGVDRLLFGADWPTFVADVRTAAGGDEALLAAIDDLEAAGTSIRSGDPAHVPTPADERALAAARTVEAVAADRCDLAPGLAFIQQAVPGIEIDGSTETTAVGD